MSNLVDVSLMGRRLSIRTAEDPEHVQASAKLVQDRLDELCRLGGAVASDRLLALVSLNLAGELLLKDEHGDEGMDSLLLGLEDVLLQAKGLAEAPLR